MSPKIKLFIIIILIIFAVGFVKLWPNLSEYVKQTEASGNNSFSVYEIY